MGNLQQGIITMSLAAVSAQSDLSFCPGMQFCAGYKVKIVCLEKATDLSHQ